MWITRLVLSVLLLASPVAVQAQELTRLYAPRPPAGSAYVRVVDLHPAATTLRINGSETSAAHGEAATIYMVVEGGKPVRISRDSSPLGHSQIPPADSFSTIIIARDGTTHLITDGTDGRNDLKAQLRAYNLVTGCSATVAVEDGPTVFVDVATNGTAARAINPVEARLVGKCGDKTSAPLQLPPLKAGDHFSLFLVEGSSGPELRGQRDETEPYHGSKN